MAAPGQPGQRQLRTTSSKPPRFRSFRPPQFFQRRQRRHHGPRAPQPGRSGYQFRMSDAVWGALFIVIVMVIIAMFTR